MLVRSRDKTILIIEDEPLIRRLVRRILEGEGYQVEEAAFIAEGIARAQARAPHLVLLDMMLPDGSGLDFFERRKKTGLAAVPVLILSAVKDKVKLAKVIEAGADSYLAKPIDARNLLIRVRKLLRERETLSYTFKTGESPSVRAELPCRILRSWQSGFWLEAPAKLAPSSEISIQSEYFQEFALTDALFRTTRREGRPGVDGRYLNEVTIPGVSRETIERIRKQRLRGNG